MLPGLESLCDCVTMLSSSEEDMYFVSLEHECSNVWKLILLLVLAGGDLRVGHPADALPGVAPLRLLPGTRVGLQAPDGGHPGGAALRHRGVRGPADRHLRQQHRALPPAVQQDRGVSGAPGGGGWGGWG